MLLVTPVTAVLAVLLLGVNVSLAASIAPSPLHPRSTSPTTSMTALVSDLLAVLTSANTNSTANLTRTTTSTSSTDTSSTDTYQQAIETNINALNSYGQKASKASAAARAALVCQASELLFGTGVVTPQGSTYTSEEQENW
jgi:hypothetical protein